MNPWLDRFLILDQVSLQNQFLLWVSIGILVVLSVSVCFVILTIYLRLQNSLRERMWVKLQKLWSSDVLDVLSGDMSADQFQTLIPNRHRISFVKFLVPYAHRLRGSDLEKLTRLASPHLPMVEQRLTARKEGVRAWAVHVLSLFGMPKYESVIYRRLDDSSSAVAILAANALLDRKDVYYLDPVMQYLHRFDLWSMSSLTSLLSQSGEKSLPTLRKYYLNPEVPIRSRVVAAEALRRLADYKSAEDVVHVIETESDMELLSASLRLLAKIGRTQHKSAALMQCSCDNDIIRFNAFKALRHLGTEAEISIFRQSIDDSSPWIAAEAARALRDLGDTEFLNELVDKKHIRAELAMQVLAESEGYNKEI